MSLFNVLDIAGSGMSAQALRLNTTASNMANAESVSGNSESTYRARQPVFSAVLQALGETPSGVGVQVNGIVESQVPLRKQYEPGHPLANEEGYIFLPNVNMVEEMANMISASRAYQSNAEVAKTSKQLLMRTLSLGQ
ncbi:MAG TPA: flagellar basal body rod protein FlgC [Gammaproteobacteria bacterium]|nr:flagellar basal body rod protein FlgC [Gammaproteobacteria bacterium]